MIVPFREERTQRAAAERVVAHLRAGGLILYPTETVFGLGCALAEDALERLAKIKARDARSPFLLLVSDRAQAPGLRWTGSARRLADAFWPGPLTLVLRAEGQAYSPRVTSEAGGVALRETPHAGMRLVLDALGAPITSSSANPAGHPPAVTGREAAAYLRSLPRDAHVWLLDGAAGGEPPSTLLDCRAERPVLLRAGSVPLERIREVVHDVEG